MIIKKIQLYCSHNCLIIIYNLQDNCDFPNGIIAAIISQLQLFFYISKLFHYCDFILNNKTKKGFNAWVTVVNILL